MAAAFRAGQHGGIEGLVAQQRGDLADGDSRRADEDVSIEAFPVFGKPLVEGPARQMHDVVSASGAAGAVSTAVPVRRRLPGADKPLVSEGVQGAASDEIL